MSTLDAMLAALADPTRREIVARLAEGEATVTELAAPFDISQPAISRHLKVLERADLITVHVKGSRRPRRLSDRGLEVVEEWVSGLRAALEQNYRRLDALLAVAPDQPPDEIEPR